MELFVPGRICLFGEHSDWAGGYRRINSKVEQGFTIITGTNQGLFAKVSKHPGRLVFKTRLADGSVKTLDEPMENKRLLEIAEGGGFFAYVAGVAYQVLTHYHVDGIEIDNYKTTLPLRKGLSSSAAVCVLTARAFNRLYDLKMTVRGEMEMAYRGEITTPSRCGRMDQGCAYGERPILMRFDGDALDVQELCVSKPLHYIIVDLKSRKDTVKILADLNRAYPFAESDPHRGVQNYLGPVNKRIVTDARGAMENGKVENLGTFMYEAQESFDSAMRPVCPEELTAPVLHRLLAAVKTRPDLAELVLGAKGVGSQGDGTAQLLVRDEKAQETVSAILERELGVECLSLTVPATKKVRKAVITAAGHGTRLFPLTKIIRKEFMPVIDSTGRLSPLIVDHVLSAIAAGIDEVALIIQKEEESVFRRLFCEPVPPEVFAKLSEENQERARELEAAGGKLTFIHQKEQRGLGHALLGAKDWVGDQPFLLVLGDHYFTSKGDKDCYSQVLDAYGKMGDSLIGLAETSEADIYRFGTVAGKWNTDTGASAKSILSITELKEKPDTDYAKEHLRVPGLAEGLYYTVFGLYILPSRIFTLLSEMEKKKSYDRGELQLTGALDQLRTEQGMLGIPIEGEKIDIGVPAEYIRAFKALPDTNYIKRNHEGTKARKTGKKSG
ncbi:MAG: sugar phosphate nucleotidyltransferase [Treponemataceae bacterium]